jgi:hypothetical protein
MTVHTPPPARPDAPPGAARPGRRWLPTLIVLAVIAATVLGGFVVAGALPATEARPIVVGGTVTVRALPGWTLVRRERTTLPEPTGGAVPAAFTQLTRGSGALDTVALPGLGVDLDTLAILYRDQVLAGQLERLSVSSTLRRVTLRNGLLGERFSYIGTEPGSGAAIEGTVTVVVNRSTGDGAVFDGWGPEGQLRLIADELDQMVETATVR